MLPHYLAKSKRSTEQLYIHISKNNKLRVERHLLHELLFTYLFFLPGSDVFVILLRYFVYLLVTPFNYEEKRLNNAQSTHPLTTSVHHLKDE